MSILPNVRLTSTTYELEEVKIRRPRRAQGRSMSEANSIRGWRGLTRLDWRRKQHLTMRYVHGSHPRVEVEARGRIYVYDWDVAVLDILRDITNRNSW